MRREDSTPILSLARQLPGPHSPGLDERRKAGLLTSGSSYSPRLTALSRSGSNETFVARYSGATAQDSHLFPYSPRPWQPGHSLADVPPKRDGFKEQGRVNRTLRRQRQAVCLFRFIRAGLRPFAFPALLDRQDGVIGTGAWKIEIFYFTKPFLALSSRDG